MQMNKDEKQKQRICNVMDEIITTRDTLKPQERGVLKRESASKETLRDEESGKMIRQTERVRRRFQ